MFGKTTMGKGAKLHSNTPFKLRHMIRNSRTKTSIRSHRSQLIEYSMCVRRDAFAVFQATMQRAQIFNIIHIAPGF